MSNLPALSRLPVLTVTLMFSLIVLGLDANLQHKVPRVLDDLNESAGYSYFPVEAPLSFARLGIATAVLTVLSLIPIDLVSAMEALEINDMASLCSQFRAAEAFSFLIWLILLSYWTLLLVFSVMGHIAGNKEVWTTGVSDVNFTSGGGVAAPPATRPPIVPGGRAMHEIPVSYPPPQNV
ncbi:hypothetical protein DL93DRAFT_2170588 [Clavulina sp. PMI_390]|nr:hypothetical protein DL93DRAFT_2170588 [Clavulina sp. PMI_390]